jgi:Fe-S cluster assembly protein SufD
VLHEGADYQLVAIATGAAAARSSSIVRHAGRGSRLRWNAVTLTGGSQVNDSFVRIDHAAPGARTEQSFRGIAAGRSRVAFNGHMVVQGSAPSSDQSMKCLTAGPEAEADLRPQLEIYTDEVKASHGATVGKLDDTMRFYLLSRGLEPGTADALLKWAFIEEVVARVSPAGLRAEVERSLAVALGDRVIGELVA